MVDVLREFAAHRGAYVHVGLAGKVGGAVANVKKSAGRREPHRVSGPRSVSAELGYSGYLYHEVRTWTFRVRETELAPPSLTWILYRLFDIPISIRSARMEMYTQTGREQQQESRGN